MMSQAIVDAAATSGIGLTLLPTLYQTSDFGGRADGSATAVHARDGRVPVAGRGLPGVAAILRAARDRHRIP